jgi:hypothetical protein
LEKYRNIFDHKEKISTFLYDLCVSFVCYDQKKMKDKIMRKQISKLIKTILNDPSSFYRITTQVFRNSSYFVFSDDAMSTGTEQKQEQKQEEKQEQKQEETFFGSNIQSIATELRKDLSRYFLDGEEAEQFLAFVPLNLI